MKSFSNFGGNAFSLALLVLLVLAKTSSVAAAPRKDIFLRKLEDSSGGNMLGRPLAGGYSEKPVDDVEVVAAADFAFATLQSNSTYGLSADATSYEITSASTQVVAGLNIQMDITFLDSSGACVGAATVLVYDQFGEMSLTSYDPIVDGCAPSPVVDSPGLGGTTLGGYSEKPVDDVEVVAAADFAFATLQSDSKYGLSADATSYEITSASTQVVAGVNIQMNITFLDSLGACVSTVNVVVYDQFGEMSLTIYEVTDECPPAGDSSGYSASKGFTLFSILMMSLMVLSW